MSDWKKTWTYNNKLLYLWYVARDYYRNQK